MKILDKQKIIEILNKILELELAGIVRYTHYSFMIFGHNRIPIIKWLRDQANESLLHANLAGEMITHFGGHPSLGIGKLLETERHDVASILKESLDHENSSVVLYQELLEVVKDKSILLEDYCIKMIVEEELHIGEVDKMLRSPGDLDIYHKKVR
jgi:bacterioferritin